MSLVATQLVALDSARAGTVLLSMNIYRATLWTIGDPGWPGPAFAQTGFGGQASPAMTVVGVERETAQASP
jgi:hypothetical protein